jgi:predicted HicB family RNase H-like nuclease
LEGALELVEAVLTDMDASEVQVPYGQRKYSGRILLRMPPQQHRRLAMEAAEQNVSLNNLLVSRV